VSGLPVLGWTKRKEDEEFGLFKRVGLHLCKKSSMKDVKDGERGRGGLSP
jgi:hypothetical protein